MSCHTDHTEKMSHVSHERVMSYKDESCLTWKSHVLYGGVMSHVLSHRSYKEICTTGLICNRNESSFTYEYTNESWCTYE